jgi:hypothetical protein
LLRKRPHAVRSLAADTPVLRSDPLRGQRRRELDNPGGSGGGECRGDTGCGRLPRRGQRGERLLDASAAELGHRSD